MSTPSGNGGERAARGRRRRRRRARGERRTGLTLLPNLFTTANLALGFYAIVKATTGEPERAAFAIIIAGVFDALDGRVARFAGATSRFGVEYDSLADMVSFGVAPAMLAFSVGAFQELGWSGWALAFVYTAAVALRLARFNVSPGRYKGRFEGMPSPAGAGIVASTVWFGSFLHAHGVEWSFPSLLLALGCACLGLLMVSPLPFRNFKDLDLRHHYPTAVAMVIGFAVILLQPAITLFLIGLAYAISGPAEWWWRRRTGRLLEETAEEEPQAAGVPTTHDLHGQGWSHERH